MKFLIIIIFSLFSFCGLSQVNELAIDYQSCDGCLQGANSNAGLNLELYTYEESDAFEVNHIESDFDLRRADGNSRWHKGVDLRNHGQGADMQRGDAIISPEDGTVVVLNNNRYKYIAIDGAEFDFGYGHIFSHNNVNNSSTWRSGNFVLKMDEGNQNGANRRLAIINLNTCTAYSVLENRQVVLGDNIHCNDTLTTTNEVDQGDAIAAIGGSRSNVTLDFPVHLHLYKFIDPSNPISTSNCLDPLSDLEHPDTEFNLRFSFNNDIDPHDFDNWNNCDISYPGNVSNTIGVRVELEGAAQGFDASRYNNFAHDADSIQFLVKRKFIDSNEMILGPKYRSEFLLHAKNGTPYYPTDLHENYGSQTTNGISPRAYQDNVGFRPYDNYFFTDFIPRIHSEDEINIDQNDRPISIADNPTDARYNDGEYEFFVKLRNVKGDSTFSDTCKFTLDNFKPFIKSVQIDYDDISIYEKGWEDNDPSLTTINDGYIQQGSGFTQATDEIQPPFPGGILINAKSSEPLIAVSVIVKDAVLSGVEYGSYFGVAMNDEQS